MLYNTKMDFLFMIVCLILVFIIAFIYVFNRVPYTSDINKLSENILKTDPTVRNFTLGYNPNNPKSFINVVISKEGTLTTDIATYPVQKDGRYIILKEHGKIEEYDDGYRIEGIDNVNFKCPEGYHGANCALDDICGANDTNGTLKPLTYTQFNALELYRNDVPVKQLTINRETNTDEPIHPRLRIKCLDNMGNFELQACPDNSLLNKELQCQLYDVCQDNLDGYKHNYQIISGGRLEPHEYYICENHKSEKMKCADDTVFSNIMKACISQSICVGQGDATLPLNDTSYIQCRNDLGTKINCPDGINTNADTGKISCKALLCRPDTFTFDNGRLHYDYGQVTCDDKDIATTTMCNTTKISKMYTMKWAEESHYSLDNWPMEILKNGQCVVPDDNDANDILIDPIVNLRYTHAMPKEHAYDLKKRQFVCDDSYKYRWDYDDAQTTVPEYDNKRDPNRSHRIVYSGAPCQNDIITPYPFKFHIKEYPNDHVYIYVTEPVHLTGLTDDSTIYYWPVQIDDRYQHTRFEYKDDHLEISTYSTSIMPLGFKAPLNIEESNKLELIGYPNAPKDERGQYYFIASGKLEMVQLYEPTQETTLEYNYLPNNRLDTKEYEPGKFAIDMNNFTNRVVITDNHQTNAQNCTFDPNTKSMKYTGYILYLGYTVFEFSRDGNIASLKCDNLSINFDTSLNPVLQF